MEYLARTLTLWTAFGSLLINTLLLRYSNALVRCQSGRYEAIDNYTGAAGTSKLHDPLSQPFGRRVR